MSSASAAEAAAVSARKAADNASRIDSPLATMHPSSFALVMATGIVSVACHLLDLPLLAALLLWLNIVFFAVLWVLTVARVARYPEQVAADFYHHGRAVGFFTIVAGTCV